MAATSGAAKKDNRQADHGRPARIEATEATGLREEGHPHPVRAKVRTVLPDGETLWSTPIRDYNPAFTADDYAILARLRDQVREHIARGQGTGGTAAL